MNGPRGIDFHHTGVLAVADHLNDRIRKLIPVAPKLTTTGVVNAASFFGLAIAPDEIVSVFGEDLADGVHTASELPLPTELGGTRVLVTDKNGVTHLAGLFFVSPNQINAAIPSEIALGPVTVSVRTAARARASIRLEAQPSLPGIFAADATGSGPAAAAAVRIDESGNQFPVQVLESSDAAVLLKPIDLGDESEQVVLMLFGTGIRNYSSSVEVSIAGEASEVLGAAPHGRFVGLDQINVLLPRSLRGRGEVAIQVTVDGLPLNSVTINVL